MDKIEEIKTNFEKIGERNLKKKEIEENWRNKSAEFFLNKEKEKVMKMKEELCQKQLFQNLHSPLYAYILLQFTPDYKYLYRSTPVQYKKEV